MAVSTMGMPMDQHQGELEASSPRSASGYDDNGNSESESEGCTRYSPPVENRYLRRSGSPVSSRSTPDPVKAGAQQPEAPTRESIVNGEHKRKRPDNDAADQAHRRHIVASKATATGQAVNLADARVTQTIETNMNGWTRQDPANSLLTPNTPASLQDDMSPRQMDANGRSRKRQFTKRSKTGCKTCRYRKKKCDERKPTCLNCERSDNVCGGYTEPNQNGRLPVRKQNVPLQSKGAAVNNINVNYKPEGHGFTVTSTEPSATTPTVANTRMPRSLPHATDSVSNRPNSGGPTRPTFGHEQQPIRPPHQGLTSSTSTSASYTNGHMYLPLDTRRVEVISVPQQEMRPSSNQLPATLPPPAAMTQQNLPPPHASAGQYHNPSQHMSPPPPPASYYSNQAYHLRQQSYAPSQASSGESADYRHTPPAPAQLPPPSTPTSSSHSRHTSTYNPAPHYEARSHGTSVPVAQPSAHPLNTTLMPIPSAGSISRDAHLAAPLPASATRPPFSLAQHEIAKSRMLRSATYNALDKHLVFERQRCEAACERYNNKLKIDENLMSEDQTCPAELTPLYASGNPANSPYASPHAEARVRLLHILDPHRDPNSKTNAREKGVLTPGVVVERGFRCSYGYNLRLMDSCYLQEDVRIDDSALVEIGARSVVGEGTKILTSRACEERVQRQGPMTEHTAKPVILEPEVIVGKGVMIMGGVRIGRGATVWDGCLVDRDVPPGVVYKAKGKDRAFGWDEEDDQAEENEDMEELARMKRRMERLAGREEREEVMDLVVSSLMRKESARREQRMVEREERGKAGEERERERESMRERELEVERGFAEGVAAERDMMGTSSSQAVGSGQHDRDRGLMDVDMGVDNVRSWGAVEAREAATDQQQQQHYRSVDATAMRDDDERSRREAAVVRGDDDQRPLQQQREHSRSSLSGLWGVG